jgi:hypothetical protein
MNILIYNLRESMMYKIMSDNIFIGIDVCLHHNFDTFDPKKCNSLLKVTDIKYLNISSFSDLCQYIDNNHIKVLICYSLKYISHEIRLLENKCRIVNICKLKFKEVIDDILYKIINPYRSSNWTSDKTTGQHMQIIHQNETTSTNSNYDCLLNDYCNLMNISSKCVFNNPKEEFRYFCYRYTDYIRNLDLPIITKNNNYEAVLVEYRCLPHLEFLIRNCIRKLGKDWSQTIICGNLNYAYMEKIVKNIDRNIKIIKTNYDNLFPSEYSLFLSSKKFWDLLVGEKILIYQEDTCIFKNNINEFIKWDYIGAPFVKTQNNTPNCVGNGGLSLRSKSCMLKVIEKIGINDTKYNSSTLTYIKCSHLSVPPEDVYFSKNMQELNIGIVADWDSAYNFSSESLLNENSFGAHGIWVNNNIWKKMMYKNVVHTFNVLN